MLNIYVYSYIIYMLIVFFIGLITFKHKLSIKKTLCLFFLLVIIGSLIAAFRPSKTQDTELYNMVYANSCSVILKTNIKGFSTFFANRNYYSIELFYILIMAWFRLVFSSPSVFYFMQGCISNLCLMYGLICLCEYSYGLDTKEKKIIFIENKLLRLYACYTLFTGVLYTSSAIRDGLSISLAFVTIGNLLLNRKKILSFFLMVISILIHTKTIIIIPIYVLLLLLLLKKISYKKKIIYSVCTAIPILYFFRVGKIFVPIFTNIIRFVLQLFNIQAFYSYVNNLDFQLPMREGMIIVITCLLVVLSNYENNKFGAYRSIVILGLFIFTFAYPIPSLARILYIFVMFIFPVIIANGRFEKQLFVLSTLYMIPQIVYVFGYL